MLTDRFSEALVLAERLHRTQIRKGHQIPYFAHLMAVTSIVLEWDGDEDTAIAALLHDAVEDQGGDETAQLIGARFGDRVADLVLHCTDSTAANPTEKLPWLERKTAYVARLGSAGREAALITAADKLHNLTATIRDVRADGPQSLRRFNQPDRVIWYYGAVAEALEPHSQTAPVAELRAAVATLAALTSGSGGRRDG